MNWQCCRARCATVRYDRLVFATQRERERERELKRKVCRTLSNNLPSGLSNLSVPVFGLFGAIVRPSAMLLLANTPEGPSRKEKDAM